MVVLPSANTGNGNLCVKNVEVPPSVNTGNRNLSVDSAEDLHCVKMTGVKQAEIPNTKGFVCLVL